MPSLTFIALCVVAAVAGPADGWTRGDSEGWGCEIGGTPTGTQRKQVRWSQEAVSEKPNFKTIKMKLMRVSPLPRTAPKDRAVAVSRVAEITPHSAAGINEPQHWGTGRGRRCRLCAQDTVGPAHGIPGEWAGRLRAPAPAPAVKVSP